MRYFFVKAKDWKQPKYLPIKDHLNKLVHLLTGTLCSYKERIRNDLIKYDEVISRIHK